MATARGLCWTREGAAAADHMTVATLLPEEEDEEDGVEGGVAICCCWCGVFTTCVVTRVRGIVSQSDMLLRCEWKGAISSARWQQGPGTLLLLHTGTVSTLEI